MAGATGPGLDPDPLRCSAAEFPGCRTWPSSVGSRGSARQEGDPASTPGRRAAEVQSWTAGRRRDQGGGESLEDVFVTQAGAGETRTWGRTGWRWADAAECQQPAVGLPTSGWAWFSFEWRGQRQVPASEAARREGCESGPPSSSSLAQTLLASPASTAQPGEKAPLAHFAYPTCRARLPHERCGRLSPSCPGRSGEEGVWRSGRVTGPPWVCPRRCLVLCWEGEEDSGPALLPQALNPGRRLQSRQAPSGCRKAAT